MVRRIVRVVTHKTTLTDRSTREYIRRLVSSPGIEQPSSTYKSYES